MNWCSYPINVNLNYDEYINNLKNKLKLTKVFMVHLYENWVYNHKEVNELTDALILESTIFI